MRPRLSQKILSAVADVLLPRKCPLCGETLPPGRGRVLCPSCFDGLERSQPPWCPVCGKPFASPITLRDSPDHLCADCRNHPPAFDRARALGPFAGSLREVVHLFKFQGLSSLADEFAPELARLAREAFPDTVGAGDALLTFVPIDPLRWRGRGFDQARLLAQRTAAALGLPWEATLERRKSAGPQTGLPSPRRRRNLRGAFAATAGPDIAGKNLLLLDDVLTTGATASACAQALKRAGAGRVDVLTLCHTRLIAT